MNEITILYIITGVAVAACGALIVRRRNDKFAQREKDQKTAKNMRRLGSEVVAPYFEARARGEGKIREQAILDHIDEEVSDPEKLAGHVDRLFKFHFADAGKDPDRLAWMEKEIAKAKAAAAVTS